MLITVEKGVEDKMNRMEILNLWRAFSYVNLLGLDSEGGYLT